MDGQESWACSATVVGFLILLWAWTMIGLCLGKPMTHAEVEQLSARTQILSMRSYA